MQYNVAQLLKESVGSLRAYRVDEPATTEGGATERARGRLRFMRTDKGIWVSATLEVGMWSTCSRCTRPFRLPLKLLIEEEYLPTVDVNTSQPLKVPEKAEGTFTINEHHILDLTEAVRQYSITNTPMKPLCQEDCPGLCPLCGAHRRDNPCTCQARATDPRWGPLTQLLPGSEG